MPGSPDAANRLASIPTRQAILELLGEGDLTTRELRDRLPGEPSLSQVVYHLAELRAIGLVIGPVQGRYHLAP